MKSRIVSLKNPPTKIEIVEAGKGKDLLYLHGAGGHMPNDPLLAASYWDARIRERFTAPDRAYGLGLIATAAARRAGPSCGVARSPRTPRSRSPARSGSGVTTRRRGRGRAGRRGRGDRDLRLRAAPPVDPGA